MPVNIANSQPKSKALELVEALPAEESAALREILLVYNSEDSGSQLMKAIREIDRLGTKITDGYELPTAESLQTPKFRKWKKAMQGYIEHLAHPSVGRDRQAIALAHFRDVVTKPSIKDETFGTSADSRWVDLLGCRQQLVDLYNVVAPLPFEL